MNTPPNLFRDGQLMHFIRVKWDVTVDGGTTATTKVANKAIPKGALVDYKACTAYTTTAFNGTTPAIKVGIRGDSVALDDDALFAAADIAVATGSKVKTGVAATQEAGGLHTPLTEDKEIVLTFTAGAADVTTGVLNVVIGYTIDPLTGNV